MAFATHSFAREFTVAAHFFAREIIADRSKSLSAFSSSCTKLSQTWRIKVAPQPVGENADSRSRFADRGTRGSKSNRSCVISNSVSTHHEMLARQLNDRVKRRSEVFRIVVLLVKINSWPQLHLPSKKVMLLLHPRHNSTNNDNSTQAKEKLLTKEASQRMS
ncbi:unnamed protein product [Linum tenue]|uniref:Uncharacterized protein n=1 Tax=Linum tenue TaxID=586396 RepID=A0AAV0Q2V0_9ROSI|nr:unnamed protein product [Linum tenue]